MSEQSADNSEIDVVELADQIAIGMLDTDEFVKNRHKLGRTPEETREFAEAFIAALQNLADHDEALDAEAGQAQPEAKPRG